MTEAEAAQAHGGSGFRVSINKPAGNIVSLSRVGSDELMFPSISAQSKTWTIDSLRSANRGDLEPIILVFALSRAAWLAILYVGRWKFPDAFCQWDCGWYLSIVDHGYMLQPPANSFAANWAFFPLYPLAVWSFETITGLSPRLAAVLISNAAILAGVYLGCRYLRRTQRERACFPSSF